MNQWLAATETKDVNSIQTSFNKGLRHTRMVFDIEPQTGSHTMKICVVASTTLLFLLLERESHIPVTHDGFRVQGFADGHIVFIGNHYGWEDQSSKNAQQRRESWTSWRRWLFSYSRCQLVFQSHRWRTADVHKDRNTSKNCNSCFTQIYKRWLLTENIFSYLGHSFIL